MTHENLLLRTYYRPRVIDALYHQFGYDNVVLLMILLSIAIFILFSVISYLYDKIFGRIITRISEFVYGISSKLFLRIENKILKLN